MPADAGLKALRLLKLHKHTEALTRENMMDFLYTVGMVSMCWCKQCSKGRQSCSRCNSADVAYHAAQSCKRTRPWLTLYAGTSATAVAVTVAGDRLRIWPTRSLSNRSLVSNSIACDMPFVQPGAHMRLQNCRHCSIVGVAMHTLHQLLSVVVYGCACSQNPTPDVLHGKLRLLRLHKEETFTWGELAHVWCATAAAAAQHQQ